MAHNKKRGLFPAFGKGDFEDFDQFIQWYMQGGCSWPYTEESKNSLFHGRYGFFNEIAPLWDQMYGNWKESSADTWAITRLKEIAQYMRDFGGQYDIIHLEEDIAVIQFGENRFVIPPRFLRISLFPDYTEKSLRDLNRMLQPGAADEPPAQSGELTAIQGLSVASLADEMGKGTQEMEDAQAQIKAIQQEQDRQIELIREQARKEIEKVERMKLSLQVKVEDLKTQIFMLESVIYTVECYIGDTVDFIQLRSGRTAPAESPLVVYQKLRYLDEDLPIMVAIYDYKFGKTEMFEAALQNRDDMVEYFCPAEKCLSFVRVSKTGRGYDINEFGLLESYEKYHGKTIGILLRNGENLYFGWTDEAKVILPDGNVFYTPKEMGLEPQDESKGRDGIEYPSLKYTAEQLEQMVPEEQKALQDKDQIAYYEHQRGLEKRKVMSKVFIFSILQGLLDDTEGSLVSIPEKVNLLNSRFAGSKYLVFSNADGWLEDNRYGSFSDILKRVEGNHKVGDMILTTMRLSDGRHTQWGRAEYSRSRNYSSRTSDCNVSSATFYRLNFMVDNDAKGSYYKKGCSFYVSVEKKWSDAGARSNFEVYTDEFINMTFLNSDWLHYAILNKKIGHFIINGQSVSYAHAVRYLRLAYEHLKEREKQEHADILRHYPALDTDFPTWMVHLSEWKLEKGVRNITDYQAKRFAKWLQAQKT